MATVTSERFEAYLQRLIEKNGLTRYRLAQLSGVTQAHIGKIVHGERTATDDVLERLAPHLDVSADELMARRDADALGPALDRIRRHAPEALVGEKQPKHPATSDELEIMNEARQLGVWNTELDYEHVWNLSPATRRPIFEDLKEEIEAVRAEEAN